MIAAATVVVERLAGPECPMLRGLILVGIDAFRFDKRDDGDPESAWSSRERGGVVAGAAEIAILDSATVEDRT